MAMSGRITGRGLPGHISIGDRSLLMLTSNDYLGLSTDASVISAISMSCHRYGAGLGIYPVFLTTDEHRQLEVDLARFLRVEEALLTMSGGAANAAALAGLVGQCDTIYSDADNHASIIDAGRLSRARVQPFRTRDPEHLGQLLREEGASEQRLVITNGVFSMDGGLAPLHEITAICARFDCILVVDDAHGTGVVGPNGRGTLAACGVETGDLRVFITGSLSKALGGAGGGFIAGRREKIDRLRQTARSFVFSQGMTSAATAAATAALLRHTEDGSLLKRLWRNIDVVEKEADRHGLVLAPSSSAIRAIVVGDDVAAAELQKKLLNRNIYIQAMTFPIVPKDAARLRLQVSAAHAPGDLAAAIATIAEELAGCP